MTNTRITDVELVERRYPVLLKEFHFRLGSGGQGEYGGGDGTVRSYQFLEPLQVSILSERRARAPYGLLGGEDGALGRNIWVKTGKGGSTRRINVGGKATMLFNAGDTLELHTPGGGGWGEGEMKKPSKIHSNEFEPRGSIAEKAKVDF